MPKVITPGRPYWYGYVLKCTRCSQVISLRSGDNEPDITGDPGVVSMYWCGCCGNHTTQRLISCDRDYDIQPTESQQEYLGR